MRKMTTLKFYSNIKVGWEIEEYVLGCNNKGREGWSWYRLGLWRSGGGRRKFPKDKCPLCGEREDEIHILLECSKTAEMRKVYIEERKLRVNPTIGLMKIMNEKKIENIRKIGIMLWRIKCLWRNVIENYDNE